MSDTTPHDVLIIGAGMSGLAAACRLAYYGKRVLIVERHRVPGGLNSYYTRQGELLETGLHAMTNFAGRADRMAPLSKLLRQLKMTHEELALVPQRGSLVRFPGAELRFTNDPACLRDSIRAAFPGEIDGFLALERRIAAHDALALEKDAWLSARAVLAEHIAEPLLIDMLLCPLMYYGSAWPDDMDFSQFAIMFRSIFHEGFCRPRGGVKALLDRLVAKVAESGGKILYRAAVRRLAIEDGRVAGAWLETGERVRAKAVLSTAGLPETEELAGVPFADGGTPKGQLSFTELILPLTRPLADAGHDATIVFHGGGPRFAYRRPDEAVSLDSCVLCCPDAFAWDGPPDHAPMLRVTCMADWERWCAVPDDEYRAMKRDWQERILEHACRITPLTRDRIRFTDFFTPRTVARYTARWHGAVYGSPVKRKDGTTPLPGLYLCGTDQGFLGIVGSMLSGVSIANRYLLA